MSQGFACRPFAGNDEQGSGHDGADVREHPHEEIDIFLVRDPADVGHERTIGGQLRQRPEALRPPLAKTIRGQTRWQNVDRGRDAVLQQNLAHRLGGRDQCLHVGALRAGEFAGQRLPEAPRQHRDIVVQIFLEERVVRGHTGDLERLRQADAGVVRDERRVDVHQIDILEPIAAERLIQCAPAHAPILGVSGDARGRNPNDGRVGLILRTGIVRSDQKGLDVAAGEIVSKRPDGRGHAIDAWKEDVGNEQSAQVLRYRIPTMTSGQRQTQHRQRRTDSGARDDI